MSDLSQEFNKDFKAPDILIEYGFVTPIVIAVCTAVDRILVGAEVTRHSQQSLDEDDFYG